MTKRQFQDYLQDILDTVAAIEQFTTGEDAPQLKTMISRVLADLKDQI